MKSLVKNKKGQATVEYILTPAALFVAFVLFYQLYSHIIPKQFENGAKIILSVYELDS